MYAGAESLSGREMPLTRNHRDVECRTRQAKQPVRDHLGLFMRLARIVITMTVRVHMSVLVAYGRLQNGATMPALANSGDAQLIK